MSGGDKVCVLGTKYSNFIILKATDALIIICDEHRILQDYKSICD